MSDSDDHPDPMMNVNIEPLNGNYGDETCRRIGFNPDPVQTMEGRFESRQMLEIGPSKIIRTSRRSEPFIWKLVNIPVLPEFHPVEQTAIFIQRTVPSLISARISKILRERSIEATYEDDKAKVKCVTEEGVDFRIRLYRGRGEYSHGIIVEVQRRFGFSTVFHNETQAILDAAKGKATLPPVSSSLPLPVVSDAEDDYEPEEGSSALDMVSKMLSHPGYDSTYLGLQTLSSLTDSSKIGSTTARNVSNSLMRLDNVVGEKVLAIILDKQDEDMFKLRSIAMTILANTMHTAELKIPNAIKEHVRPVLIKELQQAERNPRLAVQAARCVECLLLDDESPGDFSDALNTALEAGMARHAALQRQVQKCLDKI